MPEKKYSVRLFVNKTTCPYLIIERKTCQGLFISTFFPQDMAFIFWSFFDVFCAIQQSFYDRRSGEYWGLFDA